MQPERQGFLDMRGRLSNSDYFRCCWLHTGDVGVRITDRIKDLFIVGGFNCYPTEIARLLANYPAVAQAAVLGMPDERLGEVTGPMWRQSWTFN